MTTKPRPQDFPTAWAYWHARRAWIRTHGGSAIGVLAIAIVFGALTGSAWVLVTLVGAALLGLAYMRSRP